MKSLDIRTAHARSNVQLVLRAAQCITFAVLLALLALPVRAQEAPATLTLEDAIRLAQKYNPQYRSTANDASAADWQVRQSYAALVPQIDFGGGASYQLAGTERIGNFENIARPAAYGSSYNVSASMGFSGATPFYIAQARASRASTDARIANAAFQLTNDVTKQYLAAMRTNDEVKMREQLLKTAQKGQEIAQARYDAGDKPRLDAAQAEVASGRAEVDLVNAQNAARSARRALLQMIGVNLDRDVELTTTMSVFEPKWTLEELTAAAVASHPALVAARAAESAGKAGVRAAKMSYLPSIGIGGTLRSGFTHATADNGQIVASAQQSVASQKAACESDNELNAHLVTPLPGYPKDCSQYVFTDADRESALASNKLFPFNFTSQPANFGLSISLPIFNGFQRELQTEQARAQAQDATFAVRAEELNRRALVANAYDALQTAYKTVSLEERNTAVSDESLNLAQVKYSAGAGSIYELMQAQALKAQADQAHLAAIYAFHENLALLENAVGKALRPDTSKN